MARNVDKLYHVDSIPLGNGGSTLPFTAHDLGVAQRYVDSLEAQGLEAPEITTSIRCACGGRVELPGDGSDIDCERCGRPYNAFGQALSRGHGECFCPDCC